MSSKKLMILGLILAVILVAWLVTKYGGKVQLPSATHSPTPVLTPSPAAGTSAGIADDMAAFLLSSNAQNQALFDESAADANMVDYDSAAVSDFGQFYDVNNF